MACETGYEIFSYVALALCAVITAWASPNKRWNDFQSTAILFVSLVFVTRHILLDAQLPYIADYYTFIGLAVSVLVLTVLAGLAFLLRFTVSPFVGLPIIGVTAVYNLVTNIDGLSYTEQAIIAATVGVGASAVMAIIAHYAGIAASLFLYILTGGVVAPITGAFIAYLSAMGQICDDPASVASKWPPWMAGGLVALFRLILYLLADHYTSFESIYTRVINGRYTYDEVETK